MDLSAWTPAAISLIPSHPHTSHTLTRPTLSHFLTYPTPSQVIWEYPGETKLQCTCWQFNRRMWYVLNTNCVWMAARTLTSCLTGFEHHWCYKVNFEQLAVAENEPRASPGLYLSDLTTQWAMTTTRQPPTLTILYTGTAQVLNPSVAHLATVYSLNGCA